MHAKQSLSSTETKLGHFNSLCRAGMVAALAAVAFNSSATMAQSMAVKEDAAQLKADKAALQRQLKRLDADEVRLKSDTASGKMSAESKDALEVYRSHEAVKAEKAVVATDKDGSLQMKADRAALQRQLKRLEAAEARLIADRKEGKIAAESKDTMQVYRDQQAIKGEKKDIADDKSKLKADQKK